MANEKSQNVQDVFLNHVRKDNFSVLLRRDGHTQLVYKHAISTVMPGAPIQLFDASKVEVGAPVREMATDDAD
jgi:host factor-I protein